MGPATLAAIAVAGFVAGTVNAVVGSGTLLTFPTLLAAGYPPVIANVSNTIGIFFGTVGSVFGYRRELAGQRSRILLLMLPAVAGGILGSFLLLVLPQRVFKGVVPVLIGIAVVLVILQPWLTRHLSVHFGGPLAQRVLLPLAAFLTAIYGGYFGAAQGVILMGIFLVLIDDSAQRLNGLKNVCAAITNLVSSVYFVLFAQVAWEPALVIGVTSLAGSQVGSALGRRLSPLLLRAVIVVACVAAVARLLFF